MAIDYGRQTVGPNPVKSTASVIAIIAALGSFFLSARGREILALMAAGAGILFGLMGFLKAASPRVSGGILSLAAVALSAIAVIVALIALVV
jgi:hypothetical protein